MTETEILRCAIQTYGAEAQELMLFEEMAELQKEICKNRRGRDNVMEIAEEIADVRIMLEQMEMIFGCAGRVRMIRAGKLRRLRDLVEQELMERAAWMAADPETPIPAARDFPLRGKQGGAG